jgi:hypothetical protein
VQGVLLIALDVVALAVAELPDGDGDDDEEEDSDDDDGCDDGSGDRHCDSEMVLWMEKEMSVLAWLSLDWDVEKIG